MITRHAASERNERRLSQSNLSHTSNAPSLSDKSTLQTYLLLASILTCTKLLLATSSALYRSTDFDVHRNWLAVTRHLPLGEWYYDDVNGTTVHTLDYPPLFAYFEYMLSSNPITNWLLEEGHVDERCLALLGDEDNTPSDKCVVFHRLTVILSDLVLYIAAWFASHSIIIGQTSSSGSSNGKTLEEKKRVLITASLIVLNPGLLLLDHVHFQYNGMLLGVLLLSIGCIARGASKPTSTATSIKWDLLGAFFYAILLGMKHLYLTLAPLYFVYLLRHVCFVRRSTGGDTSPAAASFSIRNFVLLALITGTALVAPFIPILLATDPTERADQLAQIFRRLFPFQRGLCHDYWAANVWAVYLFLDKCLRFILGRVLRSILPELLSSLSLPDVPPSICALLLMVGLVPSMLYGWRAASAMIKSTTASAQSTIEARSFFTHAAVFSSFSGFMLAYHVHEKAIMTAIIPLTLLSTQSLHHSRLYLRTCALGHFGLLPLLYRPAELVFKTCSYVAFLAFAVWVLKISTDCNGDGGGGGGGGGSKVENSSAAVKLTTLWDRFGLLILAAVFIFMEIIHPLFLSSNERLEFLPLLLTSISCAVGLILCWAKSFSYLKDCTNAIQRSVDDKKD